MLFYQGCALVKQITDTSENVVKTSSNADLDSIILSFKGALLSHVNCLSTRKLRSPSAKLFSSCTACSGARGYSPSSAGLDISLCCLSPSDSSQPFPWPVEIPLNSSTSLWSISHFSQFVSSANLLRVHSTPSSTLNSFGAQTYLLHLLPLGQW